MKNNYKSLILKALKITTLSVVVLLFANGVFAQQIITSNNFNSDLGGWDVVHISGNSSNEGWTMVEGGPNMGPNDLPPYAGAGMAMFNTYNILDGNLYELNSPGLEFTGGNYQVSFQMYRYDDYAEKHDRIEVFYNTVAGSAGGTSLGVVNRVLGEEPVVPKEDWYEYSFDIPGTPNEVGYISIVGISEYGYNIFIDELVVAEVSSCDKPSNITYTNISSESVTINWDAPESDPSSYDYYISTEETMPTASTAPTGTSSTTSVDISGLTPLTTYYVWVRSVCDEENKSSWLVGSNLNTTCGTYSVDYEQNFDDTPYGEIPTCWTSMIVESTGYPDIQVDNALSSSEPNSIRFYNSSDISGTYYLVSPKFSDLRATRNLAFEIYREVLYGGSTDNNYTMEVGFMLDPENTDSYQTIVDITEEIMVNRWKTISVNLSELQEGEGHIVLKYKPTEGGDYNKLYIDDFSYTGDNNISVDENDMSTADVNVFPNPSSGTITISDIHNVQTVKIFDITGRLIKTVSAQKELNIAELETGVYFLNLNYKSGAVKSLKVIKK